MAKDVICLVLEDRAARGDDIPGDSSRASARLKSALRHDGSVAVAQVSGRYPRAGTRGFFGDAHGRQPLPTRPRHGSQSSSDRAVHSGKDLKRGTIQGILRQARLTVEEFNKFLRE